MVPRRITVFLVAVICVALVATALAQREAVVRPPEQFSSAEAHYKYLLERAKGGTKHTVNSLPHLVGHLAVRYHDHEHEPFRRCSAVASVPGWL
jgi:hypothetical protein